MCHRWVYIGDYYTAKLIGDGLDKVEDIWYERDGTQYGRPGGYCKACTKKRTQGPKAVADYLDSVDRERTLRHDVDLAHREAYIMNVNYDLVRYFPSQ